MADFLDTAAREHARVKRLRTTVRTATQDRDHAVRAALAAGHSQREVARATGLSHQAVAKIALHRGNTAASPRVE